MPFDNKRNSRDGKSNRGGKSNFFKKEDRSKRDNDSFGKKRGERSFNKRDRHKSVEKDLSAERYSDDKRYEKVESAKRKGMRPRTKSFDKPSTPSYKPDRVDDGLIRLNRYIANAGVCSRRKADELIEAGVISINGEVVTSLETKVDQAKDEVLYNGERLKREKLVYLLLNKPNDYITTTDDPQERKTVMHLVQKASKERIYPVGRLDRNTTG